MKSWYLTDFQSISQSFICS